MLPEDASQRRHDLRKVYNGVRSIVKTGAHWRMLPYDLPPWPVVYQQMRRWLAADCFANIVHDLRVLPRRAADRPAPPTAVILDSRTLQSTPTSGARAGYDGSKRRKGSKVRGGRSGRPQDRHVDQGYTGGAATEAAQAQGIQLIVVKLPEAKRGFVLLPRRWVVERSFAWAARFRRLARDYERLAATLAGLRFLAFACLMLHQFTHLMSSP